MPDYQFGRATKVGGSTRFDRAKHLRSFQAPDSSIILGMWKQVSWKGAPGNGRSVAGEDRGQILILTALSMTVLLGIAAMSIDASYMYDKRNLMYAAADAAAKSGAIEVHRNPTVAQGSLEVFADRQVTAHGFTPIRSGGTTDVVVNHPPLSGPFTGLADYVEVIVSESTDTFFGKVIGFTSMNPGARAVAGAGSASECIVTLAPPTYAPPAPVESMDLGNAAINMPGCSLAIDGDLNIGSQGSITANSTGVTGGCSGNGGGGGCAAVTNMILGAPPMVDPLAALVAPTNPGGCVPAINQAVLNPGCYTTIQVTNPSVPILTFNPGQYYVTGPILISQTGVFVNGSGVFFYLAGTYGTHDDCTDLVTTAGCFNIGHNATWNLSAQTSGPYTGILFFQDRANQLNAQFDGNNPLYNLSGMMYFPAADVSFRNGMTATNDCMLFVVWTLHIDNGQGAFTNVCSAFGGSPLKTVSVAE